MFTVQLNNKDEILEYLKSNVFLHIYAIGDLDDFFWKYTTWYALKRGTSIQSVILIYSENNIPTVLAISEDITHLRILLDSILNLLPDQFHAHLSLGVHDILEKKFLMESNGKWYKMGLINQKLIYDQALSNVTQLNLSHIEEINNLYKIAYPGNWFNQRMLETGQYYGLFEKNYLISLGGIHVYSEKYDVCALGNIATHPGFRGKGYGKMIVSYLCSNLIKKVKHIGLSVKQDNIGAINLYKKLGFEIIGEYEIFMATFKNK